MEGQINAHLRGEPRSSIQLDGIAPLSFLLSVTSLEFSGPSGPRSHPLLWSKVKSSSICSMPCTSYNCICVWDHIARGRGTKKATVTLPIVLGPPLLWSQRVPLLRVLGACPSLTTTATATGLLKDWGVLLCESLVPFPYLFTIHSSKLSECCSVHSVQGL